MKTINRRKMIRNTIVGSVGLATAIAPRAKAASQKKPNIIFIMTDDQGYYDLGCYGSKTMLTPRIDQMCKEGIKFTDCYSGDTVCAPARSTLMTGYHKGHTPVRANSGGTPLWEEDLTIADILKQTGYTTGAFGKWGLGNHGSRGAAEKKGFDVFFGYYNQRHAHSYYTHLYRNSEKVDLDGRYTHHAIFDETMKFIDENHDKPFFLYCPWTPPHGPLEIPEDEPAWALYKDKPKPWDKSAKVAAAMISMMDRQVGQIMDRLKKYGIDDNTIIFYTSDNGAARRFDGVHDSCGVMQGQKRSMHEGGIRVPMIVRWPGKIKAGRVSDLPCYFPDVMPTLAEIANASAAVPADTDGISVLPTLLERGEQKKHEYLYWSADEDAVRMGKWKAIGYRPGQVPKVKKNKKKKGAAPQEVVVPKTRLYDLSNDLAEQNDLSSKYPEIVKKMEEIMVKSWVEPRSQKAEGESFKDPNSDQKH